MAENIAVLGNRYVKYEQDGDNGYTVHKVVDLSPEDLADILQRTLDKGKVLFFYDRHRPKETRDIVGEVKDIRIDGNSICIDPVWNELGQKILGSETRYPSVELCLDDEGKQYIYAIAMVGEPASEGVGPLELSATLSDSENEEENINNAGEPAKELNMDKEIREIVEAKIADPAALKDELKAMLEKDSTLAPVILDILMDVVAQSAPPAEGEELEGEEEAKEDEAAGAAEADMEKGDKPEEAKEAEKKEEEKAEELTALVYEHGERLGLGVPSADSLKKAISVFFDLKGAKSLGDKRRRELAIENIKWVKHEARKATPEELSATQGKQEVSAADMVGDAIAKSWGL